ncbi:MAG: hypothetical protein KAU31_04560 [Spirochaetaceae bacterium]|nr:hypothetical protein [Spirochaetaceae bacterium]
MSIRLGDSVILKDNPNIAPLGTQTGATDQPTIAEIRTGLTIANAQEAYIRVPNLVTRQTFESTDAGSNVDYFDSVDELMSSLNE